MTDHGQPASSIEYRAPVESDIPALAELGRSTFVEAFGHLYSDEDLSDFLEKVFSHAGVTSDFRDPKQRYRIAIEDGRFIGYCKVGFDPSFDDYAPDGRTLFELKQLYLRSSHHGTGVAAGLMSWAIEQARAADVDEMVLSVWSQNHRGQAFYRKHGFDWVADTSFFVGKQRDEEFLFMRPMKG